MPPRGTSGTGVLFAGGGTGGHLLPSVAIAQELRSLEPSVRLAFAVSEKPTDARVLDAALEGSLADAEIRPLRAKPPSLSPGKLARFVASWGPSVRTARSMLREMPARTAVVSMGGYVAPPVAQAARAEKRPIVVINLDAVPGKANAWIRKRSAAAFSVYDIRDDRWERVTPIVRVSLVGRDAPSSRESLGLAPDTHTLFVTGGSLGARSINGFVLAMLEHDAGAFDGWQVVHQTGSDPTDLVTAYERAGARAMCRDYFADMGACWGSATLAISRAGAGSVAEAWATRTPALFLPYPYHKDDHQRLNTAPLVECGGAITLADRIEPAANLDSIGPTLSRLLREPSEIDAMRSCAGALPEASGATTIAKEILGMLREHD